MLRVRRPERARLGTKSRGMKRRRNRRRRSSRPFGSIVALLLALGVVAGAVALIVRGDVTPRPSHQTRRHHVLAQTPASAPLASQTGTPEPSAAPSPQATITPLAEASASPLPSEPPSAAPTTLASAVPAPGAAPSGAKLALIIDDCGQWLDTERGFIALPAPITLSVLPHVRYGDTIAHAAAAAGKGVMLHLPMEPRSGVYPGPGEIKVTMNDAAIAAQVRDDLASVPLAEGVNNHEGSRATSDDRVMRDVAAVIAEHKLFFVDSRTSAATVAERDASAAGIPTARRDVFLDDVAEVDATEAELRRAAALAKANGSAIAIGHPRPTTLIAVRTLLPELEREGITFVLARSLVR